MLVNLTQGDINKIQIDEGVVVVNFEEDDERVLGPTRGGAEFVATPSIRDIEYDGRRGKTKGLQVKDGEDVSLKIITLCCSQENLALAIPGATVATDENKTITPGDFGVIPSKAYLKNIAVVTKMLDGTFKVLIVKNPMHEGALTYKSAPKAENEHNLELLGHYDPLNGEEKIWKVEERTANPIAS